MNTRRQNWLEKAEALKPRLLRRDVEPSRLVRPERDGEAFQGWRMVKADAPTELGRDFDLVYDFGEHLVGQLSFKVEALGVVDCPCRVKVQFGEVPAEVAESFDPYTGGLGRGWLQDEVVVRDELPCEVSLPRRYSFRYVRLTGERNGGSYKTRITGLRCAAVTSADASAVDPLPPSVPELSRRIDAISLDTLRDCMQGVFEDGPKRDRRLWLGDFRLQALVNYRSFKNYALAKRCLYLFAALAAEDGRVPSDLYDKPSPHAGRCDIFDYVAIYPSTLLEYAQASGDWDCAAELWPVARRQAEIVAAEIGPDGLFMNQRPWWCFIDWNEKLNDAKLTPEQGVAIFGLKRTLELGRALGKDAEVACFEPLVEQMSQAALANCFDAKRGVFVSGADRQVSWASQAWMTIAGVVSGEAAKLALLTAMADQEAVRPAGPYLNHYVVEALFLAGLPAEAEALLESYWGEMARLGADCFWEVFDPEDQFRSPYGSHLVNSYCHAWSCTPSYFLRGGVRRR